MSAAEARRRTELDLGQVLVAAEVFINERSAGVRLARPFKFDLSGLTPLTVSDVEDWLLGPASKIDSAIEFTAGFASRLNRAGPTLIVLAEFKAPVYDRGGLSLITSSIRRFPPATKR